ncbi:MAG: sugar ABC transporter permease [Chloroflexi bacterium]|nr:sugar ABC transporter permease [Chloroflexota bacterium]
MTPSDTTLTQRQEAVVARRARGWLRGKAGLLFVLPALTVYSLFVVYPVLYSTALSFYEWNGFQPTWTPAGLANYQRMLEDPVFGIAFKNTLMYAASLAIFQPLLALGLALVLDSLRRARIFFRTLLFIPYILSHVMVSLLFNQIYEPNFGLLNEFLRGIGRPEWTQIWLGNATLAVPAIILVGLWQGLGFGMVVYLAGLQNIPQELKEAAQIDGATAWGVIRHVTIPLLRPVTLVVVVLVMIGSFKMFDYVFLMTQGGPAHSTQVLASYVFHNAFVRNYMGYASAIALVMMALTLSLSFVQSRLFRSDVEY